MTELEPPKPAQSLFSDPASLVEAGADPELSAGAGPIPGVAPEIAAGLGTPMPSASEQAFGPLPKPPTSKSKSNRPTLVQGQQGPAVMDLQAELNEAGEALAIDGMFGPLTRAAVIRFQRANALAADGIVGPITWDALDSQGPAPQEPAPASDVDVPDVPLLDPRGDEEPGNPHPELGDPSGAATVGIGDAEGNLDEDRERRLETLERDGGETESFPGLGSPGNLFGFGEKRTPVANPNKAGLIAGAFADLGNYAGTGFADANLDSLLADYGAFWSVDVRSPATGAPDPEVGKGGDSAGKGVSTQPPWVKKLQNKIIGRAKWDDDDRATQKLIEAFLRDFARDRNALAPGVEDLMHQVGAGETNGQANSLGGFKGGQNWCAQASQFGLILGMYNRGIRFKTTAHHADYGKEMTSQIGAYSKWTKVPGKVVGGTAAHTAQLEAGDIISVVNGGKTGPLSGHVATVVEHTGDRIVYISGNAAGTVAFEGAVRIEEVTREQPPAGYDWLAIAGRENSFQAQKQIEKANQKGAKDDERIMLNDKAIIESQLPGVPFPKLDVTSPASVLAYTAVATARSNEAASSVQVQTAAADMIFRSTDRAGDLAKADAAASQQQAMLGDDGLPVSRDPTVDKRFLKGVHAPEKDGVSWVVEVIKASALTALQTLATGAVTVPNDPAVEAGRTLAQQCLNAPPEVINQQHAK